MTLRADFSRDGRGGSLFPDERSQNHAHIFALKSSRSFNCGVLLQFESDFFHQFDSKASVSHFTSAKLQSYFNFIAFLEELYRMVALILVIMSINIDMELNFLGFIGMLLLLGSFLFFVLFVDELSVIHHLDNRRACLASDFNQIKLGVFTLCKCLFESYNTYFCSIVS